MESSDTLQLQYFCYGKRRMSLCFVVSPGEDMILVTKTKT